MRYQTALHSETVEVPFFVWPMVGEVRLELTEYHYDVPDLQSGATPNPSLPFTHRGHTKNGVSDGSRTRDRLDHNQVLYR